MHYTKIQRRNPPFLTRLPSSTPPSGPAASSRLRLAADAPTAFDAFGAGTTFPFGAGTTTFDAAAFGTTFGPAAFGETFGAVAFGATFGTPAAFGATALAPAYGESFFPLCYTQQNLTHTSLLLARIRIASLVRVRDMAHGL